MCMTHPLIVIHQTAPVQHMHHGLKAEDWLPIQLVAVRDSQCPSSQLHRLVSLSPSKLLLPNLHTQADDIALYTKQFAVVNVSDMLPIFAVSYLQHLYTTLQAPMDIY